MTATSCRVRFSAVAFGNMLHVSGDDPAALDQAIATQQVVLAREIVEVPLAAIDAVHQGRIAGRLNL